MSDTSRILDISFPDQPAAPSAELEQERRIAVFDLIECGHFVPLGDDAPDGPWHLAIRHAERRVHLEATTRAGAVVAVEIPLTPLRKSIRHYFALCDDYADAVRHLPADRIEALDEARRAAHDEGAAILRDRLATRIALDETTARRLFTLFCVLTAPKR